MGDGTAARPLQPSFAPPCVLIVDDEPDTADLIRQQFRRQIRANEIAFRFAANGAEALDLIRDTPNLDLLITDLNMPVMDGLTLLANLAAQRSSLRAVVVSAYGDMPRIRAAMNRGAADFLMKPIDFADMEATLRKLLDQARTHRELLARESRLLEIERELSVAGQIQQSLLPVDFDPFQAPGWSVHAGMKPAKAVGGDLYDLFHLPSGELGFVVGDVSGKGVPAALFMAVSRTLLRAAAMRGASPAQALAYTNETLIEQNPASMFVTLFCGYLDRATGVVRFSCAGHNPPVWLRPGGPEFLQLQTGIMAGIFGHAVYADEQMTLAPGESLLVYSDGITESMTEADECYGEERLLACCAESVGLPPEAIAARVIAEASLFAGSAPQSDDMTVLALGRD